MTNGHDRYLIYQMLGRRVELAAAPAGRRRRLSGVVDRVCRNIFENVVELTVGGKRHSFREPRAILAVDEVLVFVYGGIAPAADDEVFKQTATAAHSGETLYDVLGRTEGCPESRLTFRLGEKVRAVRPWRRRKSQESAA
jgi:hypothetical protein